MTGLGSHPIGNGALRPFGYPCIHPAERRPFVSPFVSASVSARRNGRFCPLVSASKKSVPDSSVRDWLDDWVGVGSSAPAVSTIQFHQTAETVVAQNVRVLRGYSLSLVRLPVPARVSRLARRLLASGLCPQKIPFPATGIFKRQKTTSQIMFTKRTWIWSDYSKR
jgi:hypothetical protein